FLFQAISCVDDNVLEFFLSSHTTLFQAIGVCYPRKVVTVQYRFYGILKFIGFLILGFAV
ncbi:unnamed protein product, partial [Brassica rapa subsp. trilocularis]